MKSKTNYLFESVSGELFVSKADIVQTILGERLHAHPKLAAVNVFAPSNIALCKYWGKRNQELNLPMTPSLSISLGNKGATTVLKIIDHASDVLFVNDQPMDLYSSFGKRLVEFLNLFRKNGKPHFEIRIHSNIPIAAGMASSASGFAALVLALNDLFGWELLPHELSILARLGSGSACRSIWQGFVEWRAGVRQDGMDSHGEFIEHSWPELCIGLLVLSDKEKGIGSREAMQRTVSTSPLYSAWPAKVHQDLSDLKQAISLRDFHSLGKAAESNALTMHATMMSAWPSITYHLPETITAIRKIWQLRSEGLLCYFTQDAGPNLKVLFPKNVAAEIVAQFPLIEIIQPFAEG